MAAAVLCVQDAQVYMFDEPSSFLDVKQRITAAQTVRSLQTVDNYIVVVEWPAKEAFKGDDIREIDL